MSQSAVPASLYDRVASHEADMVALLSDLIRIPALGPRNGGPGEAAKAAWLEAYCRRHGLVPTRFEAPDADVPSGTRPSLVVRVPGRDRSRTNWGMSHRDVVPPGNDADWTVTATFEPKRVGGRLYGRGSEDNGQSLAAAFWALQSVLEEGLQPTFDVALLFVADEETGSDIEVMGRCPPALCPIALAQSARTLTKSTEPIVLCRIVFMPLRGT